MTQRTPYAHQTGRHWTEREDATLRRMWGNASTAEIAQAVGKSKHAVSARASALRLSMGETK